MPPTPHSCILTNSTSVPGLSGNPELLHPAALSPSTAMAGGTGPPARVALPGSVLSDCRAAHGNRKQAVPALALFPTQIPGLFSHLKPPPRAPGRKYAPFSTSPIWLCASALPRDELGIQVDSQPVHLDWNLLYRCQVVGKSSCSSPTSPGDPRAPGGTNLWVLGLLEEPLHACE